MKSKLKRVGTEVQEKGIEIESGCWITYADLTGTGLTTEEMIYVLDQVLAEHLRFTTFNFGDKNE